MANEWLVLLESPISRAAAKRLGQITWESAVIPAFTIRIAPERVGALRALPGVRRLEPPAS